MNVIVGDLLTVEEIKYIVLEMLNYDGNDYAFVNKMTNEEEATEDFYIFKILGDSISVVVEENLKNVLMLKFQALLRNDIEKIMED